ncbi:MAG: hypothetical protein M9900_00740 [Flavobacteriales bacterium]|nr:hypothetical protein [Flavobacteriales bacterium]
MMRSLLLSLIFAPVAVFGATGGPDQYGYLWKDSDEPGGPVYSWVDITVDGIPITDLADDNTHGPFIMSGNMPYYWYDVKKVWVGSNGYVAFGGGNIAANFPALPAAGGTDNYIAAFMADLTFGGTGNPAQCFLKDEATRLIISWINVPFWSVNAPGYTGSNTFQLILSKQDSTITMQYQSISGTTSSNGPVIGIESITGSIGLARSQSLMPAAGYAVRFYNPATPLLQVKDAAVDWVGEEGTGGLTLATGSSLPLATMVHNTGNQPLDPFTLTSKVLNASGQAVLTETVAVPALQPGGNIQFELEQHFVPTATGTYRHQVVLSGITGEMISTNNTMQRELVVYAPSEATALVSWAGTTDDGVGLAWNGGDGGIAAYIMPPYYPCQITGTTVRIASNSGSNFAMMVYDDDGPGGAPGTLLDSSVIAYANGGPGDHVYTLPNAIQCLSGGYYVVWYMLGANVNIAVDIQAPFSLRCYEVLSGSWAEYRDRSNTDFHLGLRVAQPPFTDIGVAGLFGINNGQQISTATTVQALVQNYGNTPVGGFQVKYRFNNGPEATQNYTGNPIGPGNSAIVTFAQQLLPIEDASGPLCVWTVSAADLLNQNDTLCVNVDIVAGIQDHGMAPLTLWPSPAQDAVQVSGLPAIPISWTVSDVRGTTVLEGNATPVDGTLHIGTDRLAPGTYVLQCKGGGTTLRGRFVVQH